MGVVKAGGGIVKSAGFGNHAVGLTMAGGIGMASRSKGEGLVSAVAKGAFWYAADALVPGAFALKTIGAVAGKATQSYMDEKRYGNSRIQKNYNANFGGNFRDSQTGYTMRQRGVAAMQQSKISARSVLGSEARTFHTSF